MYLPIIIYKIATGVRWLRQILVNSFLKAIPSSAAHLRVEYNAFGE